MGKNDLKRVAIDARMINNSGIGIVLRGLFHHWAENPPPFDLVLMGRENQLTKELPSNLRAEIVHWDPELYGVSAALKRPFSPNFDAWYSPHYATCLRPGVPLVCHIQDVLHITHPPKAGTAAYMRAFIQVLRRRAKFVLTTTRHVKVQLQTLYRFDPWRVLISSLGAGLMPYVSEEDYALPSILRGRDYLISIGIFKPHKNWAFLFERLSLCRDIDLPLVCLGLGANQSDVAELAARFGLQDRVVFLPHLPPNELAAIYKNATALLFPSIAEGFGLPIVEALTIGTPVLIADRSPMKEIAAGSAFTFDPDWPETFDGALREMLGNSTKRNALIARGIERAKFFRWEKTAQTIEDSLIRARTGELTPPRAVA